MFVQPSFLYFIGGFIAQMTKNVTAAEQNMISFIHGIDYNAIYSVVFKLKHKHSEVSG